MSGPLYVTYEVTRLPMSDARADLMGSTLAAMPAGNVHHARELLSRISNRQLIVFERKRSTPAESSAGVVPPVQQAAREAGAGESEAPAPSSSIEREIPDARIPRALGTAE